MLRRFFSTAKQSLNRNIMSSNSTANLKKDSRYTLNNGLTIPVSGFGVYQTPPGETTTIVYEALKVGYRHLDSAIYYSNEAETAKGIAKFLKENPSVKRSDIFYTTKINTFNPATYDELKKTIRESYERVKDDIEYIDLFLNHSAYYNKQTRLDTWKALQEAVAEGWVKSIGVSNYGVKHLEELYAWDGFKIPPVVNQLELHPWLPRKDIQEFAKKHDILLEAYSPLTQGKKFDDKELKSIADRLGYTPAEVLLAWSYAQGFIPLAKTVTVARLSQNYNVLDHVKLDDEALKALDKGDSYEVLTWDPTVIP